MSDLEITPKRKDDFFTLMQKKMLDLIRQGELDLCQAPQAMQTNLPA